MSGFLNFGGGAAKNIDIVKVASAVNIPSSGPNGTVYIITDVDIPAADAGKMWEGDLPALRADGSALSNGDVCILGGMKSQTPVQVVSGVKVYPRAAFQRVSGVWTQKVAWIRYNGSLVRLAYYLYKDGVVAGVGSWTFLESAGEGSGTYLGTMVATCISTSPYGAFFKGPFDFTDLHTIRCLHKLYSGSYTVAGRLLVCTNVGSAALMHSSTVAYVDLPASSVAWVETAVDVTAVEGNAYVGGLVNYYIGNVNKGSQVSQIVFE